MRVTADHWLCTDPGLVHDENTDATLWLDEEATNGEGTLWLVADGHGPRDTGRIATALLVDTVREGYGDALERAHPGQALQALLRDASDRIRAVADAYPVLRGLGCSVAALAVREGRAWFAHVGSARIYGFHGDRLRRLTREHVRPEYADVGSSSSARSLPADAVRFAVGWGGMEIDVGSGRPMPVDDDCFALVTDGVWRSIDETMMTDALRRLSARDASEALVELGKRTWSDDALAAAVVRFVDPDKTRITDKNAFLTWAAGKELDRAPAPRTLVLSQDQVERRAARGRERPPMTSVPALPNIAAVVAETFADVRDAALPANETPTHEATQLISLADVSRARDAERSGTVALTSARRVAGTEPPAGFSAPPVDEGEGSPFDERPQTLLFSRERSPAAGRGEARADARAGDFDERPETLLFARPSDDPPEPAGRPQTRLMARVERDAPHVAGADAAGVEASSTAREEHTSGDRARGGRGTLVFSPGDVAPTPRPHVVATDEVAIASDTGRNDRILTPDALRPRRGGGSTKTLDRGEVVDTTDLPNRRAPRPPTPSVSTNDVRVSAPATPIRAQALRDDDAPPADPASDPFEARWDGKETSDVDLASIDEDEGFRPGPSPALRFVGWVLLIVAAAGAGFAVTTWVLGS